MLDYSALVERIVQCPVLKEGVDRLLAAKTGLLNLVRVDWATTLQNHVLYQDYTNKRIKFMKPLSKNGVSVQKPMSYASYFHVLVPGHFTLVIDPQDNTRPAKFAVASCPPLLDIARAMNADNPDQKLQENAKFFVDNCRPAYCSACKSAWTKIGRGDSVPDDDQWCIRNTKVFDGKTIKNMFRKSIQKEFQRGYFLGIMEMTINCRYTFGEDNDTYKIGGNINDMTLFKETCFVKDEDFTLDIDDTHMQDDAVVAYMPSTDEDGTSQQDDGDPFKCPPKFSKEGCCWSEEEEEEEEALDGIPTGLMKESSEKDDAYTTVSSKRMKLI